MIDDPDIDVIIEVMGGIEETKELLLRALRQGKHVVTANKDLMAVYGSELLRVAAEYRCDLFYEASVAGGIPILRSLVDGLASDRITKLMGIVNGTTNYILTKMSQNGASYEDVLAEAQALGFAEADPTSDVEGLDAARKMAILARLGFSMDIDLDDVQVKGITQVTEEDLNYGKRLGYTMKLIGIAQRDGQKVEVSVQPTVFAGFASVGVRAQRIQCGVRIRRSGRRDDVLRAGAGSLPTATAVVSDLVAVMKNMRLGVNGRYAVAPQYEKQLKTPAEIFSKYFLRIHVKDQVGAFAKITTLFSERGVSFEKILQLPLKEDGLAEIVIVTHDASQQDYEDILQQLGDLEIVERVQSSYRVEGEKR